MRTATAILAVSLFAVFAARAHATDMEFDDAQALAIAAGAVSGCGGDEQASMAAVEKASDRVHVENASASSIRTTLSFLYGGAKTMTTMQPQKCDDARAAFDKAMQALRD